jgi:2-oxoisovalerate dehydrogenase E1 component
MTGTTTLRLTALERSSEAPTGVPPFPLYDERGLPSAEPYRVIGPGGRAEREVHVEDRLLLELWEEMLFARTFDAKASALGALGRIGGYPPLLGQEAAQVGMSRALEPGDWLAPMYRDSASMIARGIPPEQILQYYSGDERGLAFPPEHRVLPFAIPVASHFLHADGIALANVLAGRPGIVLATTGDGGTSTGAFHEALNFAGTFHLPVVFGVENNQFAISVPRERQTASHTLAQKAIAYGIRGAIVDGNDVLAVLEATRYAVAEARQRRPFLVEYVTYRRGSHTTSELASHGLRSRDELDERAKSDPLDRLEQYLLETGRLTPAVRDAGREAAQVRVAGVVEAFGRIESPDPTGMFRHVFATPPPVLVAQAFDAGLDLLSTLGPAKDETENPLPSGPTQELNLRNAVNLTLRQEMEREPRIVLFGEDVGALGGVFQVTKGLKSLFGDRVFDTPLAEAAIAGVFVGLAVGGFVPVAEFQFDGFTPPAFDQIFSHVARFRQRTRGAFPLRGVIRFPYGAGVGALEHHSDSPETYFAHTAGLTVVAPSSPIEAKGLLTAAMRAEDPVIFLEPKRLYDTPKVRVPVEPYAIPLGRAHRLTRGDDVTVVTFGSMVNPTLEALRGQSAEVIDLRTLSPIDFATILASVERTGRLVIVHEAPRSFGIGAEIAATVAELAISSLKAPIKRVTGYDIVPPLRKLEPLAFPGVERIGRAVSEVLQY